MKKYELLLVLPGTLDDKESEAKAIEVLNLVKEHTTDAELVTIGKNRLAYPIKQIRYGYFYTIIFSADSASLKTLHTKLGLMRDLLRAVITLFKLKYAPSTTPAYSYGREDSNEDRPVVYQKKEVVSVVEAAEDATPTPVPTPRKSTLDLKDIDKKLDEILDEKNLVAGV
jgi:ribosomal protein S6